MSKRLYPHKRVRYWYGYDIDDICTLFKDLGLHPQTVRAWIKRGLTTMDKGKPALIYGNDLIEFIKDQNARGKCKTEFNQMFCFKCRDARHAYQNKATMTTKNRIVKVQCRCRECKTVMCKTYKLIEIPRLRKTFVTVGVLELDDCEHSPFKTHIPSHSVIPLNESLKDVPYGDLFG